MRNHLFHTKSKELVATCDENVEVTNEESTQ